ncbi:MAG: exosortase system-associated protein, TIGR04073 family [Candidatus Omnitrophica bacterium]|nr:exosortase system-associated protein, TIGR04073 family [Candidatus Omnitrophota bacterium]
MKKIISLAVLFAMLLAPVGFAATPSPWTEEKSYTDKLVGKLGYGLTNGVLGWSKLFSTPKEYAATDKNMWAGVGQGLVDTVMTTVLGAVHLVTFPVPVDVPIPSPVDISGK